MKGSYFKKLVGIAPGGIKLTVSTDFAPKKRKQGYSQLLRAVLKAELYNELAELA